MNNIEDFLGLCFVIYLAVQLLVFLYLMFIYEMSYYLEKKLPVQEERDKIVENLEEAIITRSGDSINYSNILGFKIM